MLRLRQKLSSKCLEIKAKHVLFDSEIVTDLASNANRKTRLLFHILRALVILVTFKYGMIIQVMLIHGDYSTLPAFIRIGIVSSPKAHVQSFRGDFFVLRNTNLKRTSVPYMPHGCYYIQKF
jgi:hypothetical protein